MIESDDPKASLCCGGVEPDVFGCITDLEDRNRQGFQGEIGALKEYARQILGRDPRDIDGIWRSYYHNMAMRNAGGADMRVLSVINMAQLDILGQAAGLPLYRLLGGKARQRVRV